MSAIVILRQREAAHILSDGLAYHDNGRVGSIGQKCWAFPVQGFAIASVGRAYQSVLAGAELAREFSDFDALVAGAGDCLRAWYGRHLNEGPDWTPNPVSGRVGECLLAIAGWSTARRRAEAFFVLCCPEDDDEAGEAFQLMEQAFAAMPVPDGAALIASGFPIEGFDPTGGRWVEEREPELDLLHVMQLQRTVAYGGKHYIGGHALLTTVTADGISQRLIHTWQEDRVGELVRPRPVDWRTWRQARAAELSRAAGESPLRRQMRERRETKAAKRR